MKLDEENLDKKWELKWFLFKELQELPLAKDCKDTGNETTDICELFDHKIGWIQRKWSPISTFY